MGISKKSECCTYCKACEPCFQECKTDEKCMEKCVETCPKKCLTNENS